MSRRPGRPDLHDWEPWQECVMWAAVAGIIGMQVGTGIWLLWGTYA